MSIIIQRRMTLEDRLVFSVIILACGGSLSSPWGQSVGGNKEEGRRERGGGRKEGWREGGREGRRRRRRSATTGDPHVRFLRWTLMVFLFPCAQLFVQQCLAGESLPPALAGRKVLVTWSSLCRVSFTFGIPSSPPKSSITSAAAGLKDEWEE